MTASSWFWALIGLLTGIAVSFLLVPAWRGMSTGNPKTRTRKIILIAGTASFCIFAFQMYRILGSPQLAAPSPSASTTTPHAMNADGLQSTSGDSVEAATDKLVQKLGRGEGSDADWTLLAQSFDYLGNTQAAEQARAHVLPHEALSTAVESSLSQGAVDVLSSAQGSRIKRDFPAARDAYERAIAQGSMTADSWADYADTLGSLSDSRLSGTAAKAIDAALKLNPRHPKALWLSASLALQEHRYHDALTGWQRLRAVIPAGSPDLQIVDANIEEARALSASGKDQVSEPSVRAAANTRVSGMINVASSLQPEVTGSMTLFVYAKAAKSPGPPLAVYRTAVTSWPVKFELGDELAMLPNRRLSDFHDVIVEARLSRSGQAMPASGDLQAVSPIIHPADGKSIALMISQVVP